MSQQENDPFDLDFSGTPAPRQVEQEDPVEAQRRIERERNMSGINDDNLLKPLEGAAISPEDAIAWFKDGFAEDDARKLLEKIEKFREERPTEAADKIAVERDSISDFVKNADALERAHTSDIPGGVATVARIRDLKAKFKSLIQ